MTKRKSKSDIGGNPLDLASDNIQAVEDGQVQKKAVASRGRKRQAINITDTNENIDSTVHSKSNRRSSRLNVAILGIADTTSETNSNIHAEPLLDKRNVPPAKTKPTVAKKTNGVISGVVGRKGKGRKVRSRSPAPADKDVQSDGPGVLDEIQDLRQQLQEEKDKNRLLRRAGVTQASQTSKIIPKPKGSVGAAGFSLITEMKLDKLNPTDKVLYNDILASVRALAFSAGINLGRRYKDQSITKLSKLMTAAREAEPYLARFEDDWATGQILRQYINGKRKYENMKANGKATTGKKRKEAPHTSPVTNKRVKQSSRIGEEIERASFNGSGDDDVESSEDEWTGINYLNYEMDVRDDDENWRFDGSDNDDVDD